MSDSVSGEDERRPKAARPKPTLATETPLPTQPLVAEAMVTAYSPLELGIGETSQGRASSTAGDHALLRGRVERWRPLEIAWLAAAVCVGLWLRLHDLSAEGFGGDEVHKWLAANRYLVGDLTGDDAEHPMLMKSLITLALLAGRHLGWAPETITRLDNALGGGASVLALALLGRRLFGRTVGLVASALAAMSVTLVGYQRVAKEDTLVGLFLIVVCWCMAEAKAAADDARSAEARRWEVLAACALAGMLAAKYFFFLTPIPVLFYARERRAGSAWHVPLTRWAKLCGIAFALWLALNWTPLMPTTWEYARGYVGGVGEQVYGSLYFMGSTYPNLVEYGVHGTPPWFYLVFTAVKLTPVTLILCLTGLGVALAERRSADRLVLTWLGVWFLVHSLLGSKWGRWYLSVLPALLLLAARAAVLLGRRLRRASAALGAPRLATAAASLVLVGGEAEASITRAPHHRLYISPLGGGDARADYYFPHCDYYDAGYREAMLHIATHAEAGAEVASELAYPMVMPSYRPSRLYAEWAGRGDLVHTIPRLDRACLGGRICYVVVQPGRRYAKNEAILASLARRMPWHVERIHGVAAALVYRLEPGEPLVVD
jgi:4-amino-4-deoxy-L-arabinose transferase-like glycosyltransferase